MHHSIRASLQFIFTFCFGAFVFFCPGMLNAQHLLKTQDKGIVNESGQEVLLRGMGLGGWMLQEGYMLQTAEFANSQNKIRAHIEELVGKTNTDAFYDAWLENHVTEADIIAMKNWGFNSVRLPMHYNLFTLSIQEEPIQGENTWLEKGFELTDRLLSWCKKHEMYVVLDLHAAPGGQGYDQGISDYDPSLPSLWESDLNKEKTVALWRRLADRYKDEQWIAGYDLLNEPNWDLGQNQALRSLYEQTTAAIREVDQRHIIFIEGNWFANDFTGLTPPWDDNMVYSPHKYWSFNDQASIQWVLDMRETHNVPLYLGESGENSNVWFKDAIALLEEHNIGWAWWPLKKVESVAGPLSIEKTAGYENLLNYWKGNGTAPDSSVAFDVLMDLTEKLKFDNCRLQADVVDAMFRQQFSFETIPFAKNEIPGIVYATDYDMGSIGYAYRDIEYANYQVSTGNFTSWNNGWNYRNDGVDIEPCLDQTASNGFNVGWIEDGEWLKYTLNVTNAGVYRLNLRVASSNSNAELYLEVDDAEATGRFLVPNTGGFQTWETLSIPELNLDAGAQELVFHFSGGSFNFNSATFDYKGSSANLPFKISKAITLDQHTIEMQFNKSFELSSTLDANNFILEVDNVAVDISGLKFSNESERIIVLETNAFLRSDQQLRVTYDGNVVLASDNSTLGTFERYFVENNLPPVFTIPGLIQAEDYFNASGVELEECTDLGQGLNLSYLDPGDFVEYQVNITQTAPYLVQYRVASETASGKIKASLISNDGTMLVIDEPSFPITGGWQNWQTVENEIDLGEGQYTLRLDILQSPFNLNWISFESLLIEEPPVLGVSSYPNPTEGNVNISANFSIPHELNYKVYDINGRLLLAEQFAYADSFNKEILLQNYPAGVYILIMSLENGKTYEYKIVKK